MLHCAATGGLDWLVELLLERGADVNARNLVRFHDATLTSQNEQTPLHCASAQGHAAIVRTLLECGAEIDACDHVRRAAL
jgi:ankyrin repeat protein